MPVMLKQFRWTRQESTAFLVAASFMWAHTYFAVDWLWAPPVVGWSSNAGKLIVIERIVLSMTAGMCAIWLLRSIRLRGGTTGWIQHNAVALLAFACLAGAGASLLVVFSPGVVDEDFFYVLHMARSGAFSDWYSYVHPVMAQLVAMILPFPSGFALANVIGLSTVLSAGLVMAIRRGAPAWLAMTLVVAAALSVATWFTAMQPTRDSWFTLIFLAWLLVAWRSLVDGERLSVGALTLHVFAGAVLTMYRTDAMPAVILVIGALAVRVGNGRLKRGATVWIGFVAAFSLMSILLPRMLMALDPAVHSRSDQYPISLVLNPLGHILQQDYRPHVFGEDERILGQVIDVEAARRVSIARNIPVLYQGHWNSESTLEQRHAFVQRAMWLFAENPGLFLESRWRTFAIAAGLQEGRTATYYPRAKSQGRFPWSIPPTTRFSGAEHQLLQFVDASLDFDGIAPRGKFLHWNLFPALLACAAIVLFWAWIPATAILALAVLLRTAVVFLAEPASFFQYHWTLHLAPFLFVPLAVAEWRCARGGVETWFRAPCTSTRASAATPPSGQTTRRQIT